MGLDIQALRASLQKKQFHCKERSLLAMIQQLEAIKLQQQNLLATAKVIAEVFMVEVGHFQIEATAFDTVAFISKSLASHLVGAASPTSESPLPVIKKDGTPLHPEATLRSLGISKDTKLEFESSAFYIAVKTMPGRHFHVGGIDPASTIDDVKARVQEIEGTHSDMQRLIFDGKQLEDHKTCSDYGLKQGDLMHLMPRLRGGMYDPISGRMGFEVLEDSILFEDGQRKQLDGSLRHWNVHEGRLFGFKCKADMRSCFESCRVEALFRRLQDLQSRSDRIGSEAAHWMAKAACSPTEEN